MRKTLSKMTLEELWELFPIILSEPKAYWHDWYIEEEKRIISFLSISGTRISHIGSTAIHDIWAKPIIDILIEIPETISMEMAKNLLTGHDYLCMSESDQKKSFNRGYTDTGFAERVFHLHLRYRGDNDELYFRDYLNDYSDVAKAYETLKLSLWKRYEHDRDSYTNAKEEFVKEYTKRAKETYGGRYT